MTEESLCLAQLSLYNEQTAFGAAMERMDAPDLHASS